MQVCHRLDEIPKHWQRTAVSIGNFDGVHVGHQAIFRRLRAHARDLDAAAVAITFEPHPVCFFRGVAARELLISSARQRAELVAAAGLDGLVILPFDEALAAMEPEAFVREVLVEGLRAVDALVGYDFRFGKGRAGTIDDLIGEGARWGLRAAAVEAVEVGGEPVSSTRIRRLLEVGEVASASALMGRPHALDGVVVHGAARGRALGFPTANLAPAEQLVPARGVYVTRLERRDTGAGHAAITNIGARPTFESDAAPVVIETFVLDPALPADLDLYDAPVTLALLERLREERRFDDAQALVAQIEADVAAARAYHAHHAQG